LSKYIQIDIRLAASYGGEGLRAALPNLYKLLKNYGYDHVIANEPSPYDLVEVLARIRNDPHVPENAKRPIIDAVGEFLKVRDEARELLLARKLNELDRVLYGLEDRFDDLDGKLA